MTETGAPADQRIIGEAGYGLHLRRVICKSYHLARETDDRD
jgi:hypothetical protein